MQSKSLVRIILYSNKPLIQYLNNQHLYKMIYVLEGKILISLNDREIKVSENSLVLLSTFEEHSITILEKPYTRYFVAASSDEFDSLIKDPRILTIFKNPATINNVFDTKQISSVFTETFDDMLYENKTQDEYSDQVMNCLLYKLLVYIYRNNRSSFPSVKNKNSTQMYEVQQYIDQHFHERITIKSIAEHFFISTSWLTHCFKDLTGYSPRDYLMLIRLSYAKDMIFRSDSSITDIAYLSGFSDVNNFIKYFKKRYDITPKKMQQMQQKTTSF